MDSDFKILAVLMVVTVIAGATVGVVDRYMSAQVELAHIQKAKCK